MGRRREPASGAPIPASADRSPGPGRWLVHGERLLYSCEWLRLSLADVELPDGHRFEHHVVKLKPAAVAAVVHEDQVLMMWRHRFVPDRWGWELPGGLVDEGEDPMTTAAREVEEETGWRPRVMRHLVTFQPMVGMVDSEHSVYIGRDAERVGTPTDDNEAERIQWVSLEEVPQLIAQGRIVSAGTLIALLHMLALDTGDSSDKRC